MKFQWSYETDIGKISLVEEEEALIFVGTKEHHHFNEAYQKETPLMKEGILQLRNYLKGDLKNFDLPLSPKGTEFQKKVWEALKEIPYGETKSYGDIARYIKNPKGCRAVGMANNRNPIMIMIPCHRVIGSNGKLVGYGSGLWLKKWLLALEKG